MINNRGPKSICTCGHSGDGPDSDHGSDNEILSQVCPGHGRCTVPGCECERFTWAGFLPKFEQQLAKERAKRRG